MRVRRLPPRRPWRQQRRELSGTVVAHRRNRSGWGVNFAHQGDQIFATWYTYDSAGKAWWLSMLASRTTGENFTGVIYMTNGPPFNNNTNQTSFSPAHPVGNGALSFSDGNNGSFTYPSIQ